MPAGLDDADTSVADDARAIGTHGAQTNGSELLQIVMQGELVNLTPGGLRIHVRQLQRRRQIGERTNQLTIITMNCGCMPFGGTIGIFTTSPSTITDKNWPMRYPFGKVAEATCTISA